MQPDWTTCDRGSETDRTRRRTTVSDASVSRLVHSTFVAAVVVVVVVAVALSSCLVRTGVWQCLLLLLLTLSAVSFDTCPSAQSMSADPKVFGSKQHTLLQVRGGSRGATLFHSPHRMSTSHRDKTCPLSTLLLLLLLLLVLLLLFLLFSAAASLLAAAFFVTPRASSKIVPSFSVAVRSLPASSSCLGVSWGLPPLLPDRLTRESATTRSRSLVRNTPYAALRSLARDPVSK
mmetsp:Transcript_13465/g.31480  ORF Transcript_13465/g.31480 Transcript_13465/m.31480 type:complete len:233 (+) Transcript_13465:3045-3743(+)